MNETDAIVKLKKCVDCGRANVDAAGELVCLECELALLQQTCAQLDGDLEQQEQLSALEKRLGELSQIRRRPTALGE